MTANDPTLSDIDLINCNLTAADAAEIGVALQRIRRSTHVTDLFSCMYNIGAAGGAATALVRLDLSHNKIGNDGARALAGALSKNSSLADLYLNHNDIGVDGATALAEALAENSTLADLGLGGNRIGVDGARALAGALSRNSALTFLGLWGNTNIGEDGLRALAGALSANGTLTHLPVRARSDKERALKTEIFRLLGINREEKELMQMWKRRGFLSSTTPGLLRAASKFSGLRGVYRLFRERPDILQASPNLTSSEQSPSRKRKTCT